MKTIFTSCFLFLTISLFSQPTDENLIAWYPFNGNADDASQNGHNGGVFGAILIEDRFENPNSAYFFDGEDDFIFVPDHPDLRLGQTDFTISVWINPDSIFDLQSHCVLSKRAGAGNQGYLFQLIGTEHGLLLEKGAFNMITSGSYDPLLTTNTQLEEGAWHHIVYTFDMSQSEGRFIVDNVQDVSGNMVPANSFVTNDLYIGKDKLTDGIEYPLIQPGYFGGFYFFGAIDDIRMYNRVLTDEEITGLYNEEVTQTEEKGAAPFSIELVPTIVSSELKITAKNVTVERIAISDAAGRLVLKSYFSEIVDCSELLAGTYFITFLDQNNHVLVTKKFQKM